jgi:hypothetical protein
LTDADELAVLLSIPASDAALPVPRALALDASPVVSAETNPSAKESAAAVLLVASVDPSEPASICAVADTRRSPEVFADTSTVEDDDADAVPSSLVVEALPVAVPEALIEPPPIIKTSASASPAEEASAELVSATASPVPAAKASPKVKPSPLNVPFTSTAEVEPSSVAALAVAEPDADAPVPLVLSSTTPSL